MKENRKRRLGKIDSVFVDGDHDTFYLTIDFKGFAQGFGGIALDQRTRESFERELCVLFGVTSLEETVGKTCWALWAIEGNNEPIAGLENADGKRFILDTWRKKMWPDMEFGLEREKRSIRSAIASHVDTVCRLESRLYALDAVWTDWETEPER